MAATGSHPAVKLKKLMIQVPPENSTSGRRPSQSESTSTAAPDGPGSGFNPARRRSTKVGGNLLTAMALRRMTRASITQQEPLPKPVIRYENTYKLSPDEGTEFLPSRARSEIETLLENCMQDLTYDPITAAQMSETIAEKVKNVGKSLNCPRYKFVSTVVVGECRNQGMETASRCLWDDSKDNFTTVCHKNRSMFAVVTMYAAYFD